MKRHLKIQATLSEDMKTAYLTVLKQTHRGNGFGGSSHRFQYTTDGTVVAIVSYAHRLTKAKVCPQEDFYADYFPKNITLYVNGVSAVDKCNYVPIPAKHWLLIKKAVAAYNNYDWGEED